MRNIVFCLLVCMLVACEPPSTPEVYLTPTSLPPTFVKEITPEKTQNVAATTIPAIIAVSNPLTGKQMENPQTLDHRPVVVKIQNVPRQDRPPFGLASADLVYEYRIEFGDTRFAAIFYGQIPEKVGPIRSARHIDIHIVKGYQAILVFGGAYDDLLKLLVDSDFGYRLVREGPNTAPALYRYDPEGKNYLLANLSVMGPVYEKYKIDNHAQNLEGMTFSDVLPKGGEVASQIFVRFSGGTYGRWDYEPASGRYLRFSDAKDDVNNVNEVYSPLTDRNTGEQIGAENVVIIQAPYIPLVKTSSSEVFEIQLVGSGKAYMARDGRLFPLSWFRENETDVLALYSENGQTFPFKPGQTWFEVVSPETRMEQGDGVWRFVNWMP